MSVDPNQINLNDDQRRLLAAAADHTGLPWQVVLQRAVTPLARPSTPEPNGDNSKDTAYEKLKRLGLIGCIEGTPPDLSTNKTYLQGLGRDA
jgi:hypothetical protein